MNHETREYPGIDLFKAVGAVLILMIHANPIGDNTVMGVIFREVIAPIAVPFFFATSGFLWYRSSLNKGKHYAKIRIFRMLRMYGVWSLIYFPFVFITWVINDRVGMNSLLQYIRMLVIEGSYQTIWFLNALWVAMGLVYILSKCISIKLVFAVSVPIYLLACLLSSWNGLLMSFPIGQIISNWYYSIFDTTKNGLLFGFTYVAAGAAIADIVNANNSKIIGGGFRNYIFADRMHCNVGC